MTHTASQIPSMVVGETKNAAVDFTQVLDSGEALTGTPLVVELTTTDLTITNKAVNTAVVSILGESVAIGKAVQFSVTGVVAGTTYEVSITVTTDSTPAQTLVKKVRLLGESV